MIRIKCPKCATSLSLDDALAGQVGQCDECGAKFRIPAAKAAPPGQAKEEVKRRPAPRPRDDEDDDEDEEEKKPQPQKKPSKSKKAKEETQGTIALAITMAVAVVVLGGGALFIRHFGLLVLCVSAVGATASAIMVAKLAASESTLNAILLFVVPLLFLFYVIRNWETTQRYAVAYFGCAILIGIGVGTTLLDMESVQTRRAEILWKEFGEKRPKAPQ